MRVKPFGEINGAVPVLKIRSNSKCLLAASSEGLALLEGAPPPLDAKATELALRAIDVDLDDNCLTAVLEDGCLLIRFGDSSVEPLRIKVCAPDELRCVCKQGDMILLGAARFVLALSLGKILAARSKIGERSGPIPLQRAWGKQHALHTEQVTCIAISADCGQIVSVAEDGLICVARVASMDPLEPKLLSGEAEYDDELNDGADDLLTMCVGVGRPIRQLVLCDDIVTVLCDTHQIAAYQLGCLNSSAAASAEYAAGFDVLQAPNLDAFELGLDRLWRCSEGCPDRPSCECEETGIVDIANLVARSNGMICAVLTHSKGHASLIKIIDTKRPLDSAAVNAEFLEQIHGLSDDYVRCAAYIRDTLFLGTDNGHLLRQVDRDFKRAAPPSSAEDLT